MNTNALVADLRAYLFRLDRAIAAIEALESTGGARRGRPAGTAVNVRRGPRRMSAAARARISAAQKARWATQKGTARPQLKTATAAPAAGDLKKAAPEKRRGITPAGRKRLSEMMKKRWAERRKKKAKTA